MAPKKPEISRPALPSSYAEVFDLLERSLPGSSAAVYLMGEDGKRLVLAEDNSTNEHFSKKPRLSKLSFDLSAGPPTLPAAMSLAAPDQAVLLSRSARSKGSSLIASPLSADDHFLGLLVVSLESADEKPSKAAWQNVQAAARILQLNLTQESELGDLNQFNDFLTDMVSRSRNLDITGTAPEIMGITAAAAAEILPFNRLTISMRISETGDTLKVVHVAGSPKPMPVGSEFLSQNVCHGEVFRQVKGIALEDMSAGSFEGRFELGDLTKSNFRSFAGVPIIEAGVSKGTLAVESKQAGRYSPNDLHLLTAISQVYGTALCWTMRYQEVHALATVDGLTQLLNSRSFTQRMGEELERDARYGHEMTMLMLDIDDFKLVNDTYGHLYGNYVIKQTARIIRASIRVADVAGRLGGDEFGVVIINSDSNSSRKTAKRIQHSIANYKFDNDGIRSHVTISVGMSEYPEHGATVKDIIKHADEAMYTVKHDGGNGVVSYSELSK